MNVILIGMPGCGKSTVGVLLAKSLVCDFVDTDLIFQSKFKKTLCEILEEDGLEGFKEKENLILKQLTCSDSVIATGGSAVYCHDGMKNLKSQGKVIYLKLSPEEIKNRIKNITTRGIAMKEGTTIEDLYKERSALYEKYADYTIDCHNTTAEECVNKIVKVIGGE